MGAHIEGSMPGTCPLLPLAPLLSSSLSVCTLAFPPGPGQKSSPPKASESQILGLVL